MGLIQAYLIELSAHNPSLLKARQSYLMASNLAMPMVLAPIGQSHPLAAIDQTAFQHLPFSCMVPHIDSLRLFQEALWQHLVFNSRS